MSFLRVRTSLSGTVHPICSEGIIMNCCTGHSHSPSGILQKVSLILIVVACIIRGYYYIYPKDLWLDEAMLAVAIDNASWSDLFRGKFIYNQSCPLFFAVINKLLSEYTAYSPHVLYAIPTLLGMLVVIFMYFLCRFYEKSEFMSLIAVALVSISAVPLYYSSEFKQYIYECCVAVVLCFCFLRDLHSTKAYSVFLSLKYPLLFSFCLLVSNTSIFISLSIMLSIFLYVIKMDVDFLKSIRSIAIRYGIFIVVAVLYYCLFLRNKELSDYMYAYWGQLFISFDLLKIQYSFETVIIPVFLGMFYVGSFKYLSLALLPFFIAGIFLVYKRNKYVFIAFFSPFVCALIAAFGFYPLGHGGLRGARMSLYLYPLIVFFTSAGLSAACSLAYKRLSKRGMFVYSFSAIVMIICLSVGYYYMKAGSKYQQTYSFFEFVNNAAKSDDAILVYFYTVPSLQYWMRVHDVDVKYAVVNDDAGIDADIFLKNKVFVLYSHCWNDTPEKVENMFKQHGYSVATERDTGSILQVMDK